MYIFLDIDGVLNTEADWARKIYTVNPKCVKEFGKLIDIIPNCRIVLISTWRNGTEDTLLNALFSIGVTHFDKTAVSPDGCRSREIDYYLRRHPEDGYIILDDDASLYELGRDTPNLCVIDSLVGITQKDVKCIKNEIRTWRRLKNKRHQG